MNPNPPDHPIRAKAPLENQIQAARKPLASLISKSEKAQQKLKPGTWQHTMLRENLTALRLALALLDNAPIHPTPHELQHAKERLATLLEKVATTKSQFAPGTSQHTLQHNRHAALQTALTHLHTITP